MSKTFFSEIEQINGVFLYLILSLDTWLVIVTPVITVLSKL